jgi:hypothetical protein
MTGQLNKEFLGQKILLNCSSKLLTQAKLDIKPVINPPESSASVKVPVPVPKTSMNCDGLILPIKPYLSSWSLAKKIMAAAT